MRRSAGQVNGPRMPARARASTFLHQRGCSVAAALSSTVATLLFALNVSGLRAAERAELDGVWFLIEAHTPDDRHLTPAGQAAFESFDPLRDDPDTDCVPVSFTNIMHTPSPPFEIRQHDDYVEMNYEFMDVHRRVPLDATLTVESAPYTVAEHPHMGRSVGRYEGETLVVDSAGQTAKVLDTFNVVGLPQSEQMRTEERFIPDGDELGVVVTHVDPVNYREPLVVTYRFHRLDSEIMPWGCTLEGANYDERLDAAEAGDRD